MAPAPYKNDAPIAAARTASMNENNLLEKFGLTGICQNPGNSTDKRSFTGTNQLKINPITSPLNVILSGNKWVSASVKISPSNRKPKIAHLRVASVKPNC